MTSAVLRQGLNDWNKFQNYPVQDQLNGWKTWLETVEKARKYDELTKQPNCEDPAKEHILEQVMKRLEELEKKLG
jgi:hypothetical protein